MRGLHLHPLPLAGDRAGAAGELPPHPDRSCRGPGPTAAVRWRPAGPGPADLDEPTVAWTWSCGAAGSLCVTSSPAGGPSCAPPLPGRGRHRASRIVVLNDGRLAADGRADQIRTGVAGGDHGGGDRLDPAAVGGLARVGKVETGRSAALHRLRRHPAGPARRVSFGPTSRSPASRGPSSRSRYGV
jgi:hypothetical protein